MIWQNPWAWLGLIAMAVPVLIHLFARRVARVQPFPALRFLDPTRLRPARRTRITDALLLLVRMAILAAAVAALAQPYLPGAQSSRAAVTLVRAIIVDSSASMLRDSTAFAEARTAAERYAAEASVSTMVTTAEPAHMLAGAAAWLATRPGAREIVIVSDFQHGEITAADIRRIPENIGVRLERIAARTEIPSANSKASTGAAGASLQLLAGSTETALSTATLDAAVTAGAPTPSDTTRRVAIVFPNHAQREQLLREAGPLDAPWQGDLLTHIAPDTTVTHIARSDINGHSTLLIFTGAAPGTLPAAQLVSTILNATAQSESPDEAEPEVLGDDVLAAWEREPVHGSGAPDNASHGRWFWLLALVLLGLEGWFRRAKPSTDMRQEHAA